MMPRHSNRLHRWFFAPALLVALCAGCDAEPHEFDAHDEVDVSEPRRMVLGQDYLRDITLMSIDHPDFQDSTTQFNAVTRDPWFDLDRCEEPYFEYSKGSGGTAQVTVGRVTQATYGCNRNTAFWFEVPNTIESFADFGIPVSEFVPNERLSIRVSAQNFVECSDPVIHYAATVYSSANPSGFGWPSRYLGVARPDFASLELENCDMVEYVDPGGPTPFPG